MVRSNRISRKKRLCNHPNFDKRHVATMQHLSKRPALFCPAWSILSTDAIALWIWTQFVFCNLNWKAVLSYPSGFFIHLRFGEDPNTHFLWSLKHLKSVFFYLEQPACFLLQLKGYHQVSATPNRFPSFIFGIWCDVVSGCPDWWVNKIWPITEVSMPIERKWSKKALRSHRCLFQTWLREISTTHFWTFVVLLGALMGPFFEQIKFYWNPKKSQNSIYRVQKLHFERPCSGLY